MCNLSLRKTKKSGHSFFLDTEKKSDIKKACSKMHKVLNAWKRGFEEPKELENTLLRVGLVFMIKPRERRCWDTI
jgi:hypothetical protein